jgi:methyl-accepting chemotaxis protein
MAQYRRSIFIINKRFQFRFAFYVCAWMIALSFVYPLIVYNMFDYFIRYLSRDPNGPNVLALQDLRQQVMVLLAALQAIFLFVTFLVSIFMSHRIAGPLYKLGRFFAMARDGNLKEELFFREKDHFPEIAQEYNDTMKAIRTRIEGAASEIERALPEASPAARSSLEKALAQLRGLQR